MNIFLLIDGQEIGPLSKAEIFARLSAGTITNDSPAKQEGESDWKTVREVIAIAPLRLLTSEQIDAAQAAAPLAPPIVPTFFRPELEFVEELPSTPFYRKPLFAIAAAALLCVAGWLFMSREEQAEGPPVAEHTSPSPEADPPDVSSNVAGTSPATGPHASALVAAVPPAPSVSSHAQIAPPAEPLVRPALLPLAEPSQPMTATANPKPVQPHPALPASTEVAVANIPTAAPERGETTTPHPIPNLAATPAVVASSTPSTTSAGQPVPPGQASPAPASENTSAPAATPQVTNPTAIAVAAQPPPQNSPASTPLAVSQASDKAPKDGTTAVPIPKQVSNSRDFFTIHFVKFLTKPPKNAPDTGVWVRSNPKDPKSPMIFKPCLEISVSARENIRSSKTLAKAYFYDESGKLLKTAHRPSPMGRSKKQTDMPDIFLKEKEDSFYFEVPPEVDGKRWKALVIFGDRQEAVAQCYPPTESHFLLDYPEKALVDERKSRNIVRKPAIDPLVEYAVKTGNPRVPRLTLFFRPPAGVDDGAEIKGVVALSLLAGNVEEIKRMLRKEEMDGDYRGLMAFANKNKLAIIAWGASSGIWARENFDDLSSAERREAKAAFTSVANAWERGVLELGEKYGAPTKNFLLWGQCGSAHMAHALCLAKPDYFLAIHVHIPGLFEKPTPAASKVLWCITTGEQYYSYDYSLRFLADCKKLGYPITYKAIVGLGHAGHPDATAMGLAFFKFALSQADKRAQYEKTRSSSIDSLQMSKSGESGPWLDTFQSPPFYGDIINQQIYPADQIDMIPATFRVPIPSKEFGDLWQKSDH